MKTVDVEGTKVLVVRTKGGKLHATGAKCTHYGAPLEKGVLNGDRVVCPWHAACFNVTTGDIEDGPVLDALPVFKAFERSGAVFVDVSGQAGAKRRCPGTCSRDLRNTEQMVIIGNGPAAAAAVETLRQEGFSGRIMLISSEAELPYDRTKLSKNMATTAGDVQLRGEDFFKELGVELRLGDTVTEVDATARTVVCASGKRVQYTKLLCATGGRARSFRAPERFTIPGADLENIFVMRTAEDAVAVETLVKERGAGMKVVVLGSSFIGMEAAAYLVQSKKLTDVTVIGMESQPFERVLGTDIGAAMRALHESRGVKFCMDSTVAEFVGTDGAVTGVQIRDGELLEADAVIVGAGIIPSVGYLEGVPGLEASERFGITVDAQLQAAEHIYAAGDIARFPYRFVEGSPLVRIEHYDVAMDQGRVAARNMAGKPTPYSCVPFFWTQQYGKSLRYAGHAHEFEEVLVDGSLTGTNPSFVAYYLQGDAVRAVATLGRDPQAVAAMELLRNGDMPSAGEVRAAGGSIDLVALLGR